MGSDSLNFLLGMTTHKQYLHDKKKHKAQGIRDIAAEGPAPKAHHVKVVGKVVDDDSPSSSVKKGFWESLGQKALTGLDSTLDILSRPAYGSVAALEKGQDLAWDRQDKEGRHNPFSIDGAIDAIKSVQDVDDMAHAWTKGFKGEQEHTFAHMLERTGKHDDAEGIHENKIQHAVTHNSVVRGIAGFGLDVALDPTSYIGVGLVTKPLRKGVEHAVDKGLAKELAEQGFKNDKGIDYTADDFMKIIGGTEKPNVVPVGLSRKERRKWIKAHTVQGRQVFQSQSSSVAKTRRQLENLEKIKAALPSDGNNLKLLHLQTLMHSTRRQYESAIDKVGKGTLADAITRADSKVKAQSIKDALEGAAPTGTHQLIGGELSEHLDEAVNHANLLKVVTAFGRHKSAVARLEKLKPGDKDYDLHLSRAQSAEDDLRAETSQWHYKSALTGHETVVDLLHQTDDLVKDDMAGRHINTQIRYYSSKMAEHPKNSPQWKTFNTRRQMEYDKLANEKARIFHGLMKGKAQGYKPEHFANDAEKSEFGEIESQLDTVNRALKGDHIDRLTSGMGETHTGKKESDWVGSLPTEPHALKKIQRDLQKRRNEIITNGIRQVQGDDFLEAPDEVKSMLASGKTAEDVYRSITNGEIEGEWADRFKTQARSRYHEVLDKHVDAEIAKRGRFVRHALDNNYTLEDMPPKLQGMFVKETGKMPLHAITVDGKKIAKKDRAALKDLVTDADRKAAEKFNKNSAEEFEEATGGRAVVSAPVTKKPEDFAFDRIFTEQHGMSPLAASNELQIASGRYVTAVAKDEPISHAYFKDWARQHPEEMGPGGFGLKIGEDSYAKLLAKYPDDKQEARRIWEKKVKDWFANTPDAEVNKRLDGLFQSTLR